jgi:hypothetical protein
MHEQEGLKAQAVKHNQKRFQSRPSKTDTGYDSGSSGSLGGSTSASGRHDSESFTEGSLPSFGLDDPQKMPEPMKIEVSSFLSQATSQPAVAAQEREDLQQASENLTAAMRLLESSKESERLNQAAQQLQTVVTQCLQTAGGSSQAQKVVLDEQAAQQATQQLQAALKQCLQTTVVCPQPDAFAPDFATSQPPLGYQNQPAPAPTSLDAAQCIASSLAQHVAAAYQKVQQDALERQMEMILQTAVHDQCAQAVYPYGMAPLSQLLPPAAPPLSLHGSHHFQAPNLLEGMAPSWTGTRHAEHQTPELWQTELLKQMAYQQAYTTSGLSASALPAASANPFYPEQAADNSAAQTFLLSGNRHSAFSKNQGGESDGPERQKNSRPKAATVAAEAPGLQQQPQEDTPASAPGAAKNGAQGGRWMQYLKASPQNNTTMRHNLQDLENMDHNRILLVRKINRLGIESPDFLEAHFSQYGKVELILAPHSHVKLHSGTGWRLRPTCLGFIVMSKVSEAQAILAMGAEQQVRGGLPGAEDSFVTITVSPFEKRQSTNKPEEDKQSPQ